MARHPEEFGAGEPLPRENFLEHLQRPALMRRDLGPPVVTAQCHRLDRQGPDVHPPRKPSRFLLAAPQPDRNRPGS